MINKYYSSSPVLPIFDSVYNCFSAQRKLRPRGSQLLGTKAAKPTQISAQPRLLIY